MLPSVSSSVSSLLIVLSSVRATTCQDSRDSRSVLIAISVAFLSLPTSINVLQSYQLHLQDGRMLDAIRKRIACVSRLDLSLISSAFEQRGYWSPCSIRIILHQQYSYDR